MFHIREIHPLPGEPQPRLADSTLELVPENPQADAVCSLFREFLANHPPEFKEKIPFLKRGDLWLDWAAAPGGVAMATLLEAGSPVCISVLLTGIFPEADQAMLSMLRQTILEPMLGGAQSLLEVEGRPLLVTLHFPGWAELAPTATLLNGALASVYFRLILMLHAEAVAGQSSPEPTQ